MYTGFEWLCGVVVYTFTWSETSFRGSQTVVLIVPVLSPDKWEEGHPVWNVWHHLGYNRISAWSPVCCGTAASASMCLIFFFLLPWAYCSRQQLISGSQLADSNPKRWVSVKGHRKTRRSDRSILPVLDFNTGKQVVINVLQPRPRVQQRTALLLVLLLEITEELIFIILKLF